MRREIYEGTWIHDSTGNEYRVLFLGLQEADLTPMVAYQAVQGGPVWFRPVVEFFDGRFYRHEGSNA